MKVITYVGGDWHFNVWHIIKKKMLIVVFFHLECDSKDRIFTRNLLGNAVGMQLFREFLIGTAGEKCYRCWLDLERIRRMPDGDERRKLMLYVRNMYLADGAPDELDSAGKYAVFEGNLVLSLIMLRTKMIILRFYFLVINEVRTLKCQNKIQTSLNIIKKRTKQPYDAKLERAISFF